MKTVLSRIIKRVAIRKIRTVFSGAVAVVKYFKAHPESLREYVLYAWKLGLAQTLQRAGEFVRRGGPRAGIIAAKNTQRYLRSEQAKSVTILTTPHCLYVAQSISLALSRIGIDSTIIYDCPSNVYDDNRYFVICPQMFKQLPARYISLQMEQAVSSRWFTGHYLRILENSVAVIDYSIVNISFLTRKGLNPRQLFYIPIDYIPDYAPVPDHTLEDYDIVFYGDVNNMRRQKYLDELGKHFSVKIINDLFGKPLYEFLARARIVVNIHYYPGALLETTRIWECLSLHKLVVSEYASDMEQHTDLIQLVDFVDIDDLSGMVERVRYWLENDNLRRDRIAENRCILQRRPNQFDYFFYRFLLATDNITFEEFWDQAGNKVELTSESVCLSLPEYVERASEFNKDNRFGFSCFPGLRHSQSWIGCAMSYKFLSMLARKHNLSKITICEDDVEFLPGFAEKWQDIQDHLNDPKVDWDIFSGLLADLDKDVHIHEAHQYKGQQFATIDRLISMVFNVYSQRVFELISEWDVTNSDVTTNTIDRYIEKQRALKILTVDPFLVGHKESQQSTLWGIKNTEYAKLILASNRLLNGKIRAYEANTNLL